MKILLSTILALATVIFPDGQTARQSTAAPVSDARIVVAPAKVINGITPWMYGSCIEDVNHEIYGGLYAQRIFGESFEEPPTTPLDGWNAYGGEWELRDGALRVEVAAGAKLVRQGRLVGDGSVAIEVRFADNRGDNAGLILNVADPRVGPDAWVGYEISLSPRNQAVILGRHRNNWEPLRSVPAQIDAGRWHRLRVERKAALLRVFLGGSTAPLLEYTDDQHALKPGLVGVRTWNSRAAFRQLTITAGRQTVSERFDERAAKRRLSLSGAWDSVVTGKARAGLVRDSRSAYNSTYAQQVTHRGGTGTVGIANRSLNRWGIAIRQGQPMQGHLYVRGRRDRHPPLSRCKVRMARAPMRGSG